MFFQAAYMVTPSPYFDSTAITSVQNSESTALPTMALPDRAYAERQRLSPIRLKGLDQPIRCDRSGCSVSVLIESIERNKSPAHLIEGSTIAIVEIEASNTKTIPNPASLDQSPMMGMPDNSVHIPPPGSRTEAWLRPATLSKDTYYTTTFHLMGGPYGFGPDLEE